MRNQVQNLFGVLLLILTTTLISESSNAQTSCPNWQWVVKAGGTSTDIANGIAFDASGNTYVTGNFQGTVNFGKTTLTSAGAEDIFVAKLNKLGQWEWAVQASGPSTDISNSIAVDGSGNVYITGKFQGNSSTKTTFGNTSLTTYSSAVFVAKLNNSGQWQWAVNAEKADGSQSIRVDAEGNVFISGRFTYSATFGNISVSSKGSGIYVAKLNDIGQWQWAVSGGEGYNDVQSNCFSIDASGNIYLTGYFRETISFGTLNLTESGNYDIFVAKLNSSGKWQWAVKAGGRLREEAKSIAVDPAGNSYITGNFRDTARFGSTTLISTKQDVFVAKLNSGGAWQWAKNLETSGDGRSNTIDSSGNIYLTGNFLGTASIGSSILTSTGSSDIFVAKLNSSGQWQWAIKAGDLLSETGQTIITDALGNVFLTGAFYGNSKIGNTNLTHSGSSDIFVAKFAEETLKINAGNNETILCGSSIKINASGTGFLSVKWSPVEGLDSTNILNPNAAPTKTTTYTITALNNCGYSITSQVTITVNPIQVSATANASTINCGESTRLNATTNTSRQFVYSWSPINGLSNANVANPIARPAYTTTYTVTATSSNGCKATNQITITVNNPNPPVVGLKSSTGEKYFCNSGLALSASAGFASYKWNTGATTQTIIPTQPGTYTVEVIDNAGCGNKDSITLTPLTKIIAPDGPYLCKGQPNASVRLDAGAGFDSYEWNNGQQTQSLTVTTTGTYSVKVTKGSCQYTTSIQVMNHPGSTNAEFTHQSNGLKTQFTTLTQGVRFVDWNFGDGKNSSDLNPEHTFTQAGTYTVCLELTDFCGATDKQCKSITVSGTTNIEEKPGTDKLAVKIYPNPATDLLVIEFEKITNTPIIITDITGRQVLNTIRPISNVITLDISSLSNGLYFINLNQENYKFIKQ